MISGLKPISNISINRCGLDRLCISIQLCIPNSSTTNMLWHQVNFLSRVQLVWIQSFPFRLVALPRWENSVLPYYLHIADRRGNRFMPLPRTLAQRETLTALFKIWTLVTNPIPYDDNHYAKHASALIMHVWYTQYLSISFYIHWNFFRMLSLIWSIWKTITSKAITEKLFDQTYSYNYDNNNIKSNDSWSIFSSLFLWLFLFKLLKNKRSRISLIYISSHSLPEMNVKLIRNVNKE